MALSPLVKQVLLMPGVRIALKAKAEEIAATARKLATGHGSLASSITIDYPNKWDIEVILEHPHVVSIEYGHYSKNKAGQILGYVQGLHIMRDTAHIHK